MSSNRISANQREVIAARDSITGLTVYPTATNNKLDINATATILGTALPIAGATTALGVAIVDSSGNQISTFSITPNSTVNVAQVGGNATLTGNGVTGLGSQRVTIASDNTAFSVNANAGTNLNTSALALDTTVAKLTIAQGAALGSNTVALIGGAVTTSAPTFTTGQINQLSLTTAGGLRVDLKDTTSNTNNLNVNLAASAATVTVAGTVTTTPPANASTNVAQLAGTTTDTNSGNKSAGTLRVVIATDQPALTNAQPVAENAQTTQFITMQNAATTNVNGTTATVDGLTGAQSVEIAETGGGTATVTIKGSFDNTNFYNVGFQQIDNTASPVRTVGGIAVTGNTRHVYQVLDAYKYLQAVISGISAATITAKVYGEPV